MGGNDFKGDGQQTEIIRVGVQQKLHGKAEQVEEDMKDRNLYPNPLPDSQAGAKPDGSFKSVRTVKVQ
jgi:hypothetical protein